MFDSIWHLRGSVPLDNAGDGEVALERVHSLLEKQRNRGIQRLQNSLHFNAPFWSDPFGPSWLSMVIYDRGHFWIEKDFDGRRLHYDLRSLHIMLFCFFGALLFLYFGITHDGLARGLKFAVYVFLWIYGMNVLLAYFRVPRAIRNAVFSG